MIDARMARLIGAHIIAALILLWVPIVNGFPLVFVDSGTYLRIGTELYFPLDRPVTYGLAILPLHRFFGLWAVAIAQALFIAWLIGRVLRLTLGGDSPGPLLFVSALLAAFTGLPWIVGQIMPDLFAVPVMLIAFLLIFGWASLSRSERWLLPPLLALLIAFHLSFVPILGGVAVVGGLLGWWLCRDTAPLRGMATAIGCAIVAVVGICSLNLVAVGQFKPSLWSGSFMLTRLLDGHVAQLSLEELCPTRPLLLCQQPILFDPREPEPGEAYMWKILARRGSDRARFNREEAEVIGHVMAHHKDAVARMAIDGFVRLATSGAAGDGVDPYPTTAQIARQIDGHFPRGAVGWNASFQQQGRLRGLAIMPDRAIALLSIALNVVLFIVACRRRDPLIAGLALMTLATFVLNAALCSFLSGVFERLQGRVMWMPLFVLLIAGLRWRAAHTASASA